MAPSGENVGTGRLTEDATDPSGNDPIGQRLLDAGLVTKSQVENAKLVHAQCGGEFVDVLFSLGHLKPSTFYEYVLSHGHLSGVDVGRYEIGAKLIELLPADLARKFNIVPIDRVESGLVLGVATPLTEACVAEVRKATAMEVRPLLCSASAIKASLAKYYPEPGQAPEAELESSDGPLKLSHIARMIRQITALPALPETVVRVREAMDDPATSIEEVVETITLDPPVAAKVLSTANSAAYGFQHQINEVKLAVPLLGLRETYSLVLAVAVIDFVKKLRHVDYRTFWLDSMCCAAAARIVAKACGRRRLAGIFTAGLLHDIGRAVLWETIPKLSDTIGPEMRGQKLIETELEAVGFTHAEAGYHLAQKWDLPDEIAEPMRFHHAPEQATVVREHVAVIALADQLIQAEGTEFGENETLFEDHRTQINLLGLDAENTEAMIDEFLTLRASAIRDAFC